MQGSRDVGAQLYCALLRSLGVQARLVCSLQPLAFGSGAPTLPKPSPNKAPSKTTRNQQVREQLARYRELANAASAPVSSGATARRRLGHPNAASHGFEPSAPPAPIVRHTIEGPKRIKESAYPVYWVEILDVGHQKWQPADPVVTRTFWRPKVLEPPITDKENVMSYVIAFDADGTAKDVTVRYAKAYAAKTRKMRVDGVVDGGEQWLKTAMKPLQRHRPSDLDQIESIELTNLESREPMPRNVQDFKDHPVFALERHLRRHEVLVPTATPSGTVSSGSRGPLEKIYRRRDVRIARSVEKWKRLGREVKPMEIPAKWLPKKKRPKSRFDDREDEDDAGDAGVPIYTQDQTELYEPPPVRNGKVPRNKFGNVEVYVPSMIPKGGVHIIHEHAARAAMTVGVDYAPALTGFEFKGRQGTAVLRGVVVAAEYEEAVQAVIEGFGDVEQQMEEERRTLVALRLWRKLMMGLRIRERIWSGVDAEERHEAEKQAEMDAQLDAELDRSQSDVSEEFDMVVDDDEDMGGGFIVE